jgi:hypothetical protein
METTENALAANKQALWRAAVIKIRRDHVMPAVWRIRAATKSDRWRSRRDKNPGEGDEGDARQRDCARAVWQAAGRRASVAATEALAERFNRNAPMTTLA